MEQDWRSLLCLGGLGGLHIRWVHHEFKNQRAIDENFKRQRFRAIRWREAALVDAAAIVESVVAPWIIQFDLTSTFVEKSHKNLVVLLDVVCFHQQKVERAAPGFDPVGAVGTG